MLPNSCLLFMYDTHSDASDISDRSAVSAEIDSGATTTMDDKTHVE